MKNMFSGMIIVFCLIISTITVLSIHSKQIKEYEAQENLDKAINESIDELNCNGAYTYDCANSLLDEFAVSVVKNLGLQASETKTNDDNSKEKVLTTKDGSINIKISGKVNEDLGIIVLSVHESFKQINGSKSEVYGQASVVIDREYSKANHTVTYYINDNVFCIQNYEDGETLQIPVVKKNGKKVKVNWVTKDGKKIVANSLVDKDAVYLGKTK